MVRRVWVGAALVAMLSTAMPVVAQKATKAPEVPVEVEHSKMDLGATQANLMELLRVSPNLAGVLSSDPSLLSNQEYVAKNNPELAQFLTQHPEVARNPQFYLFSNLRSEGQQHYDVLEPKRGFERPSEDRRRPSERVLNDVLPLLGFGMAGVFLVWLLRLLLENRRWTRVFKLQSEVHGKLIERFAQSQELIGYMETDAGRRFLEASPIVTETEGGRLPNVVARVIGTMQVGTVLTLLGIGLLALRHSVGEGEAAMLVLGVVALMPGIGLMLSAGMTWLLGKRLGLLDKAPEAAAGRLSSEERS